MPEIWGLLEKSQADPQKIDEAISNAIDNHNDDEAAHLDAGQALQSHKAAEIIDHIAGSVLADKLSMSEYQGRTIFESLDKWNVTGSVQNDVWPGVVLWSDYSPANPAQLKSKDSLIPDYVDYSKTIMVQVLARIDETTNKKVYMGYGFIYSGEIKNGFGFKVVNAKLYGYSDASGELETIELTEVDLYSTHCYRAMWDKTLKKVIFFVDGVQKGSITTAEPSGGGDGELTLRIEATASGEAYLNIFEIFTARDI